MRLRGLSAQRSTRQQVLDVRGFEKLEPAVLHERDVAAHELELEHVAVMRAAEQHGLALSATPLLARLEHALDDVFACAWSSATVT